MSRQAHLPPRCPFQKKMTFRPMHESMSPGPRGDYELHPHHQKSVSQSFILEDQPAWLDDLLNDPDTNPKDAFLRRSTSDPVTILDGIEAFANKSSLNDGERATYSKIGSDLELACTYGPNSPKRRANQNFAESAIVSALSECLSQNSMQNLDMSRHMSRITSSNLRGDDCGSAGELNVENRAVKRHPGQRSRVRKLQYIAELERTVNVLQTLEADLAARVTSLLQQRVALSMENSKLKQQVAKLQQEKLLIDGQHQSLQKELERLKKCVARTSRSDGRTHFRSSSASEIDRTDASWQMLDMGKLNLS